MWKLDPFHIIWNVILMYYNRYILFIISREKDSIVFAKNGFYFGIKNTLNTCIGPYNILMNYKYPIFNLDYDYNIYVYLEIPVALYQ